MTDPKSSEQVPDTENVKKLLDDLKTQRANTKGCISRIKNVITSKADTLSATELECRLGILESYWKLILSHQTSIERLSPTDSSNMVARGELEDLYCEVKAKILSLLPNKSRVSASDGNLSFIIRESPKPNLPPLKLPQFSGKYSDYPNFIATFNKLVHDDNERSATEKYALLRNCLSGPAMRTIESLGSSAQTYVQALEKLKERYDNKSLIFQEHISELFDIPRVAKGSATQLRSLVDNFSAHVSALRILGSDTDIVNALIIYLINTKLDTESQAKWDEAIDYQKLPTWVECEALLSRRCQFLEAKDKKPQSNMFEANSSNKNSRYKSHSLQSNRASTSLKVSKITCEICSDSNHSIASCPKFSNLPVTDRFEQIKRLSLCINCLKRGHSVKNCRASMCRVCSRPHNTLLHRYPAQSSSLCLPSLTAATVQNPDKPSLTTSAVGTLERPGSFITASFPVCTAVQELGTSSDKVNHVILATAVVQIRDRAGSYHSARALLDSASQLNFITGDLAHKLRLKRQNINADISGIGDVTAKVRYETFAAIKSRVNSYETHLHMWILPSITGKQPERPIDTTKWKIPQNVELADPTFQNPQAIDLLIGADTFFELLSIGQIRLGEDCPTLQKTLLGWIVCGRYKVNTTVKRICNHVSAINSSSFDQGLNDILERFWSLETLNATAAKLTDEQQKCERMFLDKIRQLENGKLMVKLPFKESPVSLGNSCEIAKNRFLSLERKLDKDPLLKQEYSKFLQEYLDQDHMEEIPVEKIPEHNYFMPHHCVLRPDSSSTKLRVVFDASCRTSSQVSLNDKLMVGPTVQDDLFSILLRFRCWKFALTADVAKMYRQIMVYPEDRDFQCIVWRNHSNQNMRTFRLKTVTYGTASAPYLATRSLNYIADINASLFPLAHKIIKEDFYVDDLLTGADSLQEMLEIKREVQAVLQTAQMELRKWYSNDSQLLEKIPEAEREKPIKLNDSEIIKTLGIAWDPTNDNFRITYKFIPDSSLKITKRTVLSIMSRLFDPLGLINPVVVRAKIFMQELWLLQLGWDESVPAALHEGWKRYHNELHNLNKIQIPRFVLLTGQSSRTQIHGFSDASTRAYGCCIYARSFDDGGNLVVNLLSGKSKVAPTKTIRSLPCLELCGAELLAQLLVKVLSCLRHPVESVFLWTDSQIVLGWLASHAALWQTFVGNRVSRIQELTPNATWRYVNSKSNPADIISRGATVVELQESCWFRGPDFLHKSPEHWPQWKGRSDELPERRKVKTVLTCTLQESLLEGIYNRSSFTKNRRIFAYILRFITNLRLKRRKEKIMIGELSAPELEAAFLKIIWLIQRKDFQEDIDSLQNTDKISPKSCLQALNPFLDNSKLLRVGGRLQNADVPYTIKSPILLPKNNPFVKSYVRYLHFKNFHAGPQALIGLIRQQCWIINARDYTRRIVRECLHCFRYRPRLLQQMMGNLPADRVSGSSAFEIVGIDFCGPIWTTYKIRGKRPYKSYIAVFVCFVSKGVHLEVVSDLSSEGFLAALKRFTSRRRLCRKIYCDNATNFVGARRILAELREQFLSQSTQTAIARWCAEQNVEFHHTPPRSPHFGGIWEAAVKSAKSHLIRTLQNSLLTFEELCTVCCQVEAILNSRPITQQSSDPNDESALTPAHFWNQAPIDCIIEPDLSTGNIRYVNRWRRLSALQQHFWRRWSSEYLTSLHLRYKWKFSSPNVVVGLLALLHDDNLPPQKWMLGKVIKAIPGPDGKVRVVDIHTKAGVFRRSIHKLAPLPLPEDVDSP